jgi:hypothetical protein
MALEPICKNCKHWGLRGGSGILSHACIAIPFPVTTSFDMSCPRFEMKEAEIPDYLKNWRPVWQKGAQGAQEFYEAVYSSNRSVFTVDGWWTYAPKRDR